jgi:hypothetical protein
MPPVPPAGFRRLFDIGSQLLRNLPSMLGGSSLGASDGVVVRAQERAGGREAVCACVAEK